MTKLSFVYYSVNDVFTTFCFRKLCVCVGNLCNSADSIRGGPGTAAAVAVGVAVAVAARGLFM